MFFIPIIFFNNNNKGEIDQKKAFKMALVLLIIFGVFSIIAIFAFFDIFITDYISTELFFVLGGVFGFSVPFIVK